MDTNDINIVRVTTDDQSFQFWAVATSRQQAADRVLEIVPEGWSACLVDVSLNMVASAISNMVPGEARELLGARLAIVGQQQ
jgi:hypothetical protein